MIRSFPEIDYVCTQEGDYAFPMFVERLLREGDPRAVPGIARRGESAELVPPPRVDDMDSLPIPTYHDYFGAIARSPLLPELDPGAQIETSRGCWWGEKHHCTFCGLNGATMQFRSKSPERAFSELVHLTKTYGVTRVDCVDNILDLRYVQTLFPTIVERELKVELFYETKANLKFPQLVTMRDAGVSAIQPGLESLSNDILRRMRKGCTGLQNICLLRWCSELGMAVAWNIIFGFPDEPPAEYDRMAELMPLLWHLQPPASCSPFRLDRFSPYHDAAEEFGLRRVRPTAAAYYVFPFGRRELERLSYFFDFDYEDDRDPRSYAGGLLREFDRWWAAHSGPEEARPRLDAFVSGERVHVVDTRACASQAEHELAGLEAEIYRRCDMPHSAASLARAFGSAGDVATVERALARLVDAKLTIEMEGQYLSLAVVRDRAPLTDGGPDRHAWITLHEAAPAGAPAGSR
jgi:ribosomal peptide maturation radical SAM protein 1